MIALKYLALGDSYTIGEQVSSDQSFPHLAVQIFNDNNIDFNIAKPKVIATTGWTTDELANGIKEANIDDQVYDLVTLLIGVNNQYRNRSVTEFGLEFESLLKKAIAFANDNINGVVVLSIPDWGITPFAKDKNVDEEKVAKEINDFNTLKKEICTRYNIPFIDITASTRNNGSNPEFLVEDLLHYNAREYKIWAEKIATYWQKHFREKIV